MIDSKALLLNKRIIADRKWYSYKSQKKEFKEFFTAFKNLIEFAE